MKTYDLQVEKIAIAIPIVTFFFPKNCLPLSLSLNQLNLDFLLTLTNDKSYLRLYCDWFFDFSDFDLPQYISLLLSTYSHLVN